MKKLLFCLVLLLGMVVSSCGPKPICAAYQSTHHYSKKNKRTPSREAAKGYFSRRARIATYE
jgi:hypothetical protein